MSRTALLDAAWPGADPRGMALREAVVRQGMRLLQNPRVMRLAQDRRVMNAVMRAMQARGRLQESVDERIETLARRLNLATRSDLRDLRRTIRMLERKLGESRDDRPHT